MSGKKLVKKSAGTNAPIKKPYKKQQLARKFGGGSTGPFYSPAKR